MYEKHTWVSGEIVTEGKLNHMEEGIASAGIPLYTPEVIGQHGGANYYTFFASLNGEGVEPIVLIKQEDPNDLFKTPKIAESDGENIDTTADAAIPMPIPGTWGLIMESPETMEIGSVEEKTDYGFYLNEEIIDAKLYHFSYGYFLFMDHIPNLEFFEADPLG